MIYMAILIVGGLNWGSIGLLNLNLVERYVPRNLVKFVYIAVGISAVLLAINRDTFLPFLGQAALPCTFFEPRIPKSPNHSTVIRVKPNTKIVYWAAEEDNDASKEPNPYIAYGQVTNSGVVVSDENGYAKLEFRFPQTYRVGMRNKKLEPHVHYRECESNLMIGPVKTVRL